MNILILDGNPNPASPVLQSRLQDLERSLAQKHHAEHIKLSETTIKPCTGCWRCWVKNPGRCFSNDDSETLQRAFIRADLVLFASPVLMGFTSALLKRTQDKLVPLLLPHIEIVNKECHHKKRYPAYPGLALLLDPEKDTDTEDLEIITDIYKRFALNFRTKLYFVKTTRSSTKEVIHAIDSV